jgi:hypothetical protein
MSELKWHIADEGASVTQCRVSVKGRCVVYGMNKLTLSQTTCMSCLRVLHKKAFKSLRAIEDRIAEVENAY